MAERLDNKRDVVGDYSLETSTTGSSGEVADGRHRRVTVDPDAVGALAGNLSGLADRLRQDNGSGWQLPENESGNRGLTDAVADSPRVGGPAGSISCPL
jgi:hypothetical protein